MGREYFLYPKSPSILDVRKYKTVSHTGFRLTECIVWQTLDNHNEEYPNGYMYLR